MSGSTTVAVDAGTDRVSAVSNRARNSSADDSRSATSVRVASNTSVSSASDTPSDSAEGRSPRFSASRSISPPRRVAGGRPVSTRNARAPKPNTSRSTGSAYGANSGAKYTSDEPARCSPVSEEWPSDVPVVDTALSKSRAAACQSMIRTTGSDPSSRADTYTDRADSARWYSERW